MEVLTYTEADARWIPADFSVLVGVETRQVMLTANVNQAPESSMVLNEEDVAELVAALRNAGWFNKPRLSDEVRKTALVVPSVLEDNHD